MTNTNSKTPGQSTLPTPNSTASFWHSEPSRILLGHQTTSEVPMVADVVIIGSGISGASAAHFLSEDAVGKDLNVVMLEAREACWGATGRNGGHCQPFVYASQSEVGAFELRNYNALKALVETYNIPCDWRSLTGVHAYMTRDLFEASLATFTTLLLTDPTLATLVKVVTPTSTSPSLADLLIPTAAGAFVQLHAASLWPYKLTSFLLERLLSQSPASKTHTTSPEQPQGFFNLQTNTPVKGIRCHRTATKSIWYVDTPRGTISTTKVLLATNAYTSAILPSFADLIVPVKGEMSALLPPPSFKGGLLDHSYGFVGQGIAKVERDDYLIQRTSGNRQLMFGGGREFSPNNGVGISDDSTIDVKAAEYLRTELPQILDLGSDREELKGAYEWSGIMGFSRDAYPWVGELTEDVIEGGMEGLWITAGFTGHGMPNTWLCGREVVEMMMGREGDLPACYRADSKRVQEARGLRTVKVADEAGFYGV